MLPWTLVAALMGEVHAAAVATSDVLEHDLRVELLPEQAELRVVDRIRLPPGLGKQPEFSLLETLQPRLRDGELQRLGAGPGALRRYRVLSGAADGELELEYGGPVDLPAARAGHGMPLGVIDRQSVYLDGASGWYPRFDRGLLRFRLEVSLPPGWHSLSQGALSRSEGRDVWREDKPQDDIYLLAAEFQRYARPWRETELMVYLLSPDEELAQRYLTAMGEFVDLYSALIGPYPYAKFALVENRWQTGYGMPSFTLLGSRVIRLPFILRSSLPHEILHNWWGNGVYVDYRGGNWSEGLTAYLADHLLQETEGEAAGYRQRTLERYANFAAEGRDQSLREFVSRHSEASQAVGYGKGLMLFHMLRRELGDPTFVAGLKTLWERHAFAAADFDQVIAAFSLAAGRDLLPDYRQWLERRGAPRLEIAAARVEPSAAGYALTLTLRQTQPGPHYRLRVPVAVTLEGRSEAQLRTLDMQQSSLEVEWQFERPPRRIDVDPDFDLFRLLDEAERPASLGRLFGAQRAVMILPAAGDQAQRQAWERLASGWQRRYRNLEWRYDDQIGALPSDAAVWVVGWNNRWLPAARQRVSDHRQRLGDRRLRIADQTWDLEQAAVVLLDPDNRRPPLALIGAERPAVIDALARKLPHYGSVGQLVFAAADGSNLHSAALPIAGSPLSRRFGAVDAPLVLPRPERLTDLLGVRVGDGIGEPAADRRVRPSTEGAKPARLEIPPINPT